MRTPQEKWPDSFLTSMREVGDPLADNTVAGIFGRGETSQVNELLTSLIRNDQLPGEKTDPLLREYLRVTSTLPVVKLDLIREAQLLFENHGNLELFVLVCASLPECYVMKKGIHVLWLTQRLNDHVLRRLMETTQMVLAVMSPGGLEPGGSGLRIAAKVRLMHAAIRHLILHGRKDENAGPARNFAEVLVQVKWDVANLGYPINQEDLIYTLLTFSYVIPRSLEKLGVRVTPLQKDAFIHAWNVIGQVMGIREDLLPESYEEAHWLFERIKDLEGGESAPGQQMTAAVLQCLKEAIPGHLLDFLPRVFMRELLDERTCAWLGVAPPGFLGAAAQKLLAAEIRGIAWVKREAGDHLLLTPHIWQWAAGHIMDFLSNYKQPPGWKREIFKIPTDLAAGWGVNQVKEKGRG